MIGIMLFIVGVFATVVNMASLTADGLAQQSAVYFDMYNLGEYVRPAVLADFGWVGVVAHPLNYAIWLYVALKRWQKHKYASWCAFAGAGVALLISVAIMTAALAAHPEIVTWFQDGAPMTTPTPTSTP